MFDRFNRRFAVQNQGGDWGEGWTPPWLEREGRGPRGPRFFMQHRGGPRGPRGHRGGPFGPRGPFGPEGPFGGPEGPGGMARRFFGRGDVKFALLDLLKERPMHGYEMIKALEERSGGFYTPSAGTIYPTLQLLEDRGLVTVQETEGKKVYSITDTGRALLDEQQSERQQENEGFDGPPWARGFGFGGGRNRWNSPEVQAVRTEAGEVARLFAIAGRTAINNPEQLSRLRSVIERTRKDLSALIYGENATQETPAAPTPETGTTQE